MTHGTDRGTTADGTTHDPAAPQAQPGAGTSAPEGAAAGAAAPGAGEASGVPAPRVPAEPPAAAAPSDPSTDEPTTADATGSAGSDATGPTPEPDAEVAPDADAGTPDDARAAVRPAVVERPRPLSPGPALTAWPSWSDVAVTAPSASGTDGTAADPVDPPHDGQDATRDDRPAAPVADGDTAGAPGDRSEPGPGDGEDEPRSTSGRTDDTEPATTPAPVEESLDQAARRPAPLDLGGLSALAMTALNAAAVGVPAHALTRPEGAGAADAAAAEPGRTDAEPTEADAAAGGPAVPASAEPVDEPGSSSDARDDAEPSEAAGSRPDPEGAGARADATGRPEDADAPAPDAADAPAREDANAPASAPAPDAANAPAREDGADPAATAAVPVVAETREPSPATPADPAATQVVPPVRATRGWPTTDAGAGDGRPVPGGPVPHTPEAEREPSPLDVFEPQDHRRRWPRTLAVVGGAAVLLGGAYVGASYALADRVPRGATVAGVEIGGMTADEARAALTSGLEERTGAPLPLVAQDAQAELDPATAGLAFDADATVARLTGVDLAEPVRLWRQLVGVDAQPPVTQVDDDALETALGSLSESVRLAPVDGTVVFADGAAHATDAVDGWELDLPAAATAIEEGWLVGERPLPLPTTAVEPDITQEETEQALTEVAQRLASAPVTVQIGDRQATLDVPTLTASASMVPVEGRLELQLDGQALTDAVLAQVPDVVTAAADARFEFQGDAPVIVGGEPGTTLDPAALASSVAGAVTADQRVAPVELVQSDPAQTRAALEALGVKEVVSEFSTPLTSEPRRTRNIATGLANITGTLVRPGETFSLTEALGPVDGAHGFVQAGAIVNGEHKDAWGGGLSQVSTTVFNAAYFAGFEDVEHTPHSEWFQRYPEGREATIFTGVLDMKWKNNTPYGALVQGFVADGRAHVRIWGTKHFTVETEKSGRSGVVAPTTVYSQSPTCEPQSAGNPGFTVTNTRRVYLNGELVDTESDTWRYKPQNRVICGSPPAPTPTP
ncbi:VanW family protein [Cellulomonas sp.]|uniref:VanW family protein n=1 Tax=Cellulomonas sp. TaxID=40001 RepID=UPI002810DFB4|nr:VanW family protein [Cellulomonas sp.]